MQQNSLRTIGNVCLSALAIMLSAGLAAAQGMNAINKHLYEQLAPPMGSGKIETICWPRAFSGPGMELTT